MNEQSNVFTTWVEQKVMNGMKDLLGGKMMLFMKQLFSTQPQQIDPDPLWLYTHVE